MTDYYCFRTSDVVDLGGGPITCQHVTDLDDSDAVAVSVEMASHDEWSSDNDILAERTGIMGISRIKEEMGLSEDVNIARRGAAQTVRDSIANDSDRIFLVDVVDMSEATGITRITPQEFLENHTI